VQNISHFVLFGCLETTQKVSMQVTIPSSQYPGTWLSRPGPSAQELPGRRGNSLAKSTKTSAQEEPIWDGIGLIHTPYIWVLLDDVRDGGRLARAVQKFTHDTLVDDGS
jgi:hypothetical protein